MNKIKHFFGWLFATDEYMATLTDEQIAIRALGRRGAYRWEQARRETDANLAKLDALMEKWRKEPLTFVFYDPKG